MMKTHSGGGVQNSKTLKINGLGFALDPMHGGAYSSVPPDLLLGKGASCSLSKNPTPFGPRSSYSDSNSEHRSTAMNLPHQ